jgi:dolichol-phosphate mannosyltransferase
MLSRGYSFQEELLYRCHQAGCVLGETPIIFENRRAGASKVNPREALRSISILLWLGAQALMGADQETKPAARLAGRHLIKG